MQNQLFDRLQKIIEGKPIEQISDKGSLQMGVIAVISRDVKKLGEIAKQFTTKLSEQQFVHVHPDQLVQNIEDISFMICKHNKLYNFKGQYRAIALTGKVINCYKRKKGKQLQQLEHQDQFLTLIEQGVIRLFEDNNWTLQKSQKNYTLSDVLLQHDMPDVHTDQVFLSTQAFSSFVPLQKSIVMLIPSKQLKPQCLNFIKSSLLHVYLDQAQLINKIITKQTFYKNSILKGIFFIEEGEIQVNSKRIMARGWTTYGKVKVSGFGWKFKPIPFIRFLAKNTLIWKQFRNDLELNKQYPFNIIHILGLNDEDDFTARAQWKGLGRKKLGGKSPKLPKILHKSFDQAKYQQIEKLRHYDNRMDDIFTYKQDLLTRKLKGIVHGKFEPLYKQDKDEKKKGLMYRINSKRSDLSKRETQPDSQPTQNILILSVLKRLQGITDLQETQKRRGFSISHEANPNEYHSRMLGKSHSKREGTKIFPMQAQQKSKLGKKSKRYK